MRESVAGIEQLSAGYYRLFGDIDLNSIFDLAEHGKAILREQKSVRLELSDARFRGAGGLVLIGAFRKEATKHQRNLSLEGIPESLIRVAGAYGMMDILELN